MHIVCTNTARSTVYRVPRGQVIHRMMDGMHYTHTGMCACIQFTVRFRSTKVAHGRILQRFFFFFFVRVQSKWPLSNLV